MYDQAKAARRRILDATSGSGPLGESYRSIANMLMSAPDSPQKTSALKRLADSCDSAMAVLEKVRQSTGNSPRSGPPPGQTES